VHIAAAAATFAAAVLVLVMSGVLLYVFGKGAKFSLFTLLPLLPPLLLLYWCW
jgi:hypothetical protein